MASEAQMIRYELLKTGTFVSFRIVEEKVLKAPDDQDSKQTAGADWLRCRAPP
jgi:hypothetical protein